MKIIEKIIDYITIGIPYFLSIILALILMVVLRAVFKKVKKEGWKALDEWSEIQAITNIGVIISFFFIILSFYQSKKSQEISIRQSDENIDLNYKGLEIDLTQYEYLKWENIYRPNKNNSIVFIAHKGSNDNDLKCFDIKLYPTFKNIKNGLVTDNNDINAIVFAFSCNDPNVEVEYSTEKIIIKIKDFNSIVYNYNPKNPVQKKWLIKNDFSLYGYYVFIEYYPSINKQNKCKIEGINNINRKKAILTELEWD